MAKKNAMVQVPMTEELKVALEEVAKRKDVSVAQIMRTAARLYLGGAENGSQSDTGAS
jgi:hypothetical protein